MRKLVAILAATLLAAFAPSRATAADVSVDLFYTALESDGEWIESSEYGYVFSPRGVEADWRPYTVGSWAFTDAGWTWVSEEPHGWATYHYGRWANLVDVGWVWVPDTEWAPAWVSWRRSPKYVGWAPLPPEARFTRTVGIKSWSDSYYDVGPTSYSFVQTRDFGAPELRRVVVQPRENVTIIRETKNITNITVQNENVFVGGPEYDVIVRESAQPVRRLRLERRTDVVFDRNVRSETFRSQVAGDELRVVAPPIVIGSADIAPARVARRVERVEVNRGWRDAGPQAQQIRTAFRAEAKAPAELPPAPKFEKISARSETRTTGNAATTAAPAPADTAPADRTTRRPAGARPSGAEPADGAVSATPPTSAAPGSVTAPSDRPPAAAERPMRDTATGAATGVEPSTTKPGRPGSEPATTPGATATTPDATAQPASGARGQKARERAGKKGDTETPASTTAPGAPGATAIPGASTTDTPADSSDKNDKKADRPGRKAGERMKKGDAPSAPDAPDAPRRGTKDAADPAAPAVDAAEKPERAGGKKRDDAPAAGNDRAPSKPKAPDRPEPEAKPAEAPEASAKPSKPEAAAGRPQNPEAAAARGAERGAAAAAKAAGAAERGGETAERGAAKAAGGAAREAKREAAPAAAGAAAPEAPAAEEAAREGGKKKGN